MNSKTCSSCALHKATTCLLYNRTIDPKTDYCTKHLSQAYHCEICNNITLNPILSPEENNIHIYCSNCANSLSLCVNCRFGGQCAFEHDSDPTPKTITQQVQTPFGIRQNQIRNPEREAKFCSTCQCYLSESKICGKIINGCNRFSS